MQASSMEKILIEGKTEVNEIFKYIENNAKELNCYNAEKKILKMLLNLGLTLLRYYFSIIGNGDVGPQLRLENGGTLKRQSKMRRISYFSIFGKFNIERFYYYSPEFGGFSPLDAIINLPNRCYSYLLQEWMDLMGLKDSFKEAKVTLSRLLGINISLSCFEEVSRNSSTSFDQYYGSKELPAAETEGTILVESYDGKGVPMIKKEAAKIQARKGKGEKRQKKKEAIVAVGYTINENIRAPETVANNLVYPEKKAQKESSDEISDTNGIEKARNIRRIASLERSRKEVMEDLIRFSEKRDLEGKKRRVVIMDGDLKLWNALEKAMAGIAYIGILDIIHVVEYLWCAANALFGERSENGKKWVYDQLLLILNGRVEWVMGELRKILKKRKLTKAQKTNLTKALVYFKNHKQWMKYNKYLKAGYPIGSGVVESTCGHTVAKRMEGCGKRWSIEGAEAMLLLRSIYTSEDWDDYWNYHQQFEQSFNYGQAFKSLDIQNRFDRFGFAQEYHEDKADSEAA